MVDNYYQPYLFTINIEVEHLIDHTVENTITELTVMTEDLTLITDHLVITYQLAIRDLKTKL